MDAQGLGRYLRESREARELTLEDAERELHIRRRVLEAFEDGDFVLPDASPVQVRGFIGLYARFLDLDEARILQYYEAARLEEGRREARGGRRRTRRSSSLPNPVARRSITDTNPSLPEVPQSLLDQIEARKRRRVTLLNQLVLLLVAVAAVMTIVFVVVRLVGQPEVIIDPQLQDLPELIAQPPTVEDGATRIPTFTPLPGATSVPRPQQVYTGRGVLVTLTTGQRTWLRVTTDGSEQFTGMLAPGETGEWSALEQVTLTASNAEALIITWNGQPQGSFGGRGQRVDVIFGLDDVRVLTGPGFDPTAEFTNTPIPTSTLDVGALVQALTPTNTPGPSPTPSDTPTITLTPSITPTPSDTPTPTETPTITPTPSDTPPPTDTPPPSATPTITPTPSQTAILPPRQPLHTHTPTKSPP